MALVDGYIAFYVFMHRLHLPQSSCDFFLSTILSTCTTVDIVGDHGLRRMCLQFMRASSDFVHVLSQNRTEIVGRSYGNRKVSAEFKWKSYRAHAMSVRSPYETMWSPYDRRTDIVPKLS